MRAASAAAQSISLHLIPLILIISVTLTTSEPPEYEKSALLSFINQVPHASRYNWNSTSTTSPCSWPGVSCDAKRSSITTLRLPGAELIGHIPSNTLSRLTNLRLLSLHYNLLTGPIPADFANLTSLRNIYLDNNRLSGEFPASFTKLTQLNRIDLSNNGFTGSIPDSLNNLAHLNRLFLQNNNFSGPLPVSFSSTSLSEFNVSNNNLNGSIPKSFSKFPESSFKGNIQLCGPPLTSTACGNSTLISNPPPSAIVPSSPAVKNHKRLSTAAIAAISVAAAVVFLILLICLFFCCVKRRRKDNITATKPRGVESGDAAAAAGVAAAGTSSSKDDLTSGGGVDGERNKLVFIRNGAGYSGYSFDLEDLLRASAEVLGKGSVGTSYKAVLEEGTTVVVKRLKDVVAAKREFELQMEVVGGSECRHENVVPLRAYYFSKDEKLLVSDYFAGGSLSALLHGGRGSGRSALDWETRMRIAVGTGRGLSHLHVSGRVVHGNIKSSNVLLRPQQGGSNGIQDGCLSDYGLNPLFGNSSQPNRVSGYRAPEVFEARKVTFKSDVYSFGVLLLELLTGKAPNQASLDEEGIDLPRWVQSVVREEWTAEVFDVELMRYNNIEEEMVQLLQIAMSCVQTVPDQRPSMPEVIRMMEEIPRGSGDTTDDGGVGVLRQSSDDPSKGSGGNTPPVASITP